MALFSQKAEPGTRDFVAAGMSRRMSLFLGFFLPVAAVATTVDAPVSLWSGEPPGVSPKVAAGRDPRGRTSRPNRITDVADPTLTRYRPEKPDGRALIVCPGGGYGVLAVDIEGEAVARRFAEGGLTVYVLHYRVPAKNAVSDKDAAPRRDLAEALRKVREETAAAAPGGKPVVGVMGFSAGGHLALEAACGRMPDGAARPDFAAAVYPAYLADSKGTLKEEFRPEAGSPPLFIVSTAADSFPTAPDYELWRRCRAAGVKAELHLYDAGAHGFGISGKTDGLSAAGWPDVAERWIRTRR